MVDFNNDSTIGTPAVDVERISILQRRYDLIEAFEDYKKKKFLGSNVSLNIVRARLISLFMEIQAMLKRRLKEAEYLELANQVFGNIGEMEVVDIIFRINDELDLLRLTKIDSKKSFNIENTEEENMERGF